MPNGQVRSFDYKSNDAAAARAAERMKAAAAARAKEEGNAEEDEMMVEEDGKEEDNKEDKVGSEDALSEDEDEDEDGSDSGGAGGGGGTMHGPASAPLSWAAAAAASASSTSSSSSSSAGLALDKAGLERARKHRFAQKKMEIAALCEDILEAPDVHILGNREHPQGWSKLGELYFLARSDPDPEVRSLATLSEMVVLRDLVPAYRIRLPTAGTFDGTETKPNNH